MASETEQKLPYKRLSIALQKFTKVLRVDIDRLKKHNSHMRQVSSTLYQEVPARIF